MIFVFIEFQFELSNHITHYFFKKYILFIHIKYFLLILVILLLFYPFFKIYFKLIYFNTHFYLKRKKKNQKNQKIKIKSKLHY